MKLIITLAFFATLPAFAAPISQACYDNAASAVEKRFADRYDREGFAAYECKRSSSGRVINCEVAASKGDGAAIDTYRVTLSSDCSRTFRVDLIGEE